MDNDIVELEQSNPNKCWDILKTIRDSTIISILFPI